MTTRHAIVFLACLVAFPAVAAKEPLMQDKGPVLANDPYHHDSQQSVGRMEGFRRLYVDPEKWPDSIAPTVAATGTGDLVFQNPNSAWVKVTIGGTEIGQVRPFDTFAIRGVKAGTYDVRLELPNRYAWTVQVATK